MKEKFDDEWEKISNLLLNYPHLFPEPEKYTKDLYLWAT